jgi:hypothetical protein
VYFIAKRIRKQECLRMSKRTKAIVGLMGRCSPQRFDRSGIRIRECTVAVIK